MDRVATSPVVLPASTKHVIPEVESVSWYNIEYDNPYLNNKISTIEIKRQINS